MTTVFPGHMNWDRPFLDRYRYVTDVFAAEDGTEQRAGGIVIPHRQVQFSVTVAEARDTQWLDTLLYSGQVEAWAIPYWPHSVRLTATAAAGANVTLATTSTTDRRFIVGKQLILHQDEHTTELCTITATAANSLTVSTLVSNWAAGTRIYPALLGSWGSNPTVVRPANVMGDLSVMFDLAPETDPGIATPSSAALLTLFPNRREQPSDTLERRVERADSLTSTFRDYAQAVVPQGQRSYLFTMETKADVATLISWFNGVKGELARFLFPTYQNDLSVVSGLGTNVITISPINYSSRLFPLGTRSRLAAIAPGGAVTDLTVTSASVTGSVETLNLSGTVPANTVLLSYLLTVRLATDTLEIEWGTSELAEAVLPMVECPA